MAHPKDTRAVIDGLCSPNRSLFRKVKAAEQWLVTGEEGWVKQATCVWSHLPNFVCQCYHRLLFKKCYNQSSYVTICSTFGDEAATICSPFGDEVATICSPFGELKKKPRAITLERSFFNHD